MSPYTLTGCSGQCAVYCLFTDPFCLFVPHTTFSRAIRSVLWCPLRIWIGLRVSLLYPSARRRTTISQNVLLKSEYTAHSKVQTVTLIENLRRSKLVIERMHTHTRVIERMHTHSSHRKNAHTHTRVIERMHTHSSHRKNAHILES
jgi:hypothetical protein